MSTSEKGLLNSDYYRAAYALRTQRIPISILKAPRVTEQGTLPGHFWQVSDQTESQAAVKFHPLLKLPGTRAPGNSYIQHKAGPRAISIQAIQVLILLLHSIIFKEKEKKMCVYLLPDQAYLKIERKNERKMWARVFLHEKLLEVSGWVYRDYTAWMIKVCSPNEPYLLMAPAFVQELIFLKYLHSHGQSRPRDRARPCSAEL